LRNSDFHRVSLDFGASVRVAEGAGEKDCGYPDILTVLDDFVLKVVALGVPVQCEPIVGLPNAIPITPSEELVTSSVDSMADEFVEIKEPRSFSERNDGTGSVFMWNWFLRSPRPPDVLGRTAMFGTSKFSCPLKTGAPVWHMSTCVLEAPSRGIDFCGSSC
jgi:hypothetical protein